jgi:hypothetical protein
LRAIKNNIIKNMENSSSWWIFLVF